MKDKFEYKYNVPTQEERKEIEGILNEYLPKDERISKIEMLRKLDFKVKNIPMIFGLSLGIIGTLIFGVGLTFILEWELMAIGIIISILGIFVSFLAYPLYLTLFKKMRNKYSDRIIELSKELLNINDGKN